MVSQHYLHVLRPSGLEMHLFPSLRGNQMHLKAQNHSTRKGLGIPRSVYQYLTLQVLFLPIQRLFPRTLHFSSSHQFN